MNTYKEFLFENTDSNWGKKIKSFKQFRKKPKKREKIKKETELNDITNNVPIIVRNPDVKTPEVAPGASNYTGEKY